MMIPVPVRRASALAALVAIAVSGCAPTSKRLRAEIARGAPGAYLAGVPFVRQHRDGCGPAALASVAAYYHLPVTQEQIADEVFLPSIGATLTIDLQRCARDHGLWCHSGRGTLADVRTWLDRGVPVIALLRLGALNGRRHHYVVATGYHARRGYVIAHTGHLSNRPIAFERFEQELADAGGWHLAACPPERVAWPLSAEGHNDLGLLLERQGKLADAVAEYQRAIKADPGKPVFHFNLGNVLAASGDAPGAERAYRKAIAIRPAFADAHNNLASVLLDVGRCHEAYRVARRAVEIDGPRAAYYLDTLGRVLVALKSYDAAERTFRRAMKEAGQRAEVTADAHLGLIEALVRSGQHTQAAAEKDRLLASTSDPTLRQRADKLFE